MNAAGLLEAVRGLGLIGAGEAPQLTPLSGGVSSDVFGIRTASGISLVVKRSIPKLRVTADWRAGVERDAAEVAWLKAARAVAPGSAPEVLGWAREDHLFVMPWIEAPVWKQEMAAGRVDPGFARKVGALMARIHSATRFDQEIAKRFPNGANFRELRIEPFLMVTAERHPDVAGRIGALAEALTTNRTGLIWGDASPKNILVTHAGPMFIDAETATMGDPAFDLAFCLSHLFLKTIWLTRVAPAIFASIDALLAGYLVGTRVDEGFSRRAAALIGALSLARVDGKSPAGYLDAAQEDMVRARAKAILVREALDLKSVSEVWREAA